MHFTSYIIALPLALAAPLLTPRQQIIPTLPALGIPEIRDMIHQRIDEVFGVQYRGRKAVIGDYINSKLPFADTVKQVIGADHTTQIDILADRLCIAGANQGSTCNELLAYAHAWYVAQQNGWTFEFVAQSLGANNMQQIDQGLRTLCLQPADDQEAQDEGLCQRISYAADQDANALIEENTELEDSGNSNSLEYFGLQAILPPPSPLGV